MSRFKSPSAGTMAVTRLADVRRFDRVEMPVPSPARNQVLVRITAVSICGSDLLGYLGQHQRIRPPTVLGHEAIGVVEAVGEDVVGISRGQRVAIDPTSGCGVCRYCRTERSNLCPAYSVIGEDEAHPGATAGWIAIDGAAVHRLPTGIPDEVGALIQPLSVALHAVRDQGQVRDGDVTLIIGAGPIGLGILLASGQAGANSIVVDPLAYRRDLAERLGAAHTIDPTAVDVVARTQELTEGYGADVSFDAVGGASDRLVVQAINATARGGRVVVAGLKIPTATLPIGEIKAGEKTIVGSHAHPRTIPEVIRRLQADRYPAAQLITHRMPMDRIADALELLERRDEQVMKVVLTPDGAA